MAQVAEAAEINLTRFIDRVAQLRYEMFDPHFSMPGGLTWEQYKAEDPSAAAALYLSEARLTILKALPALNLRPVKASTWDEGYHSGLVDERDGDVTLNPYA